MIISKLVLYNFRKFHTTDDAPGLIINFHEGLNALIGENDSGKSAVIDALKLVLLTQSNEYIRPVENDFYTDRNGISEKEFKIDCTISSFTSNEAKNFIEYLSFEKSEMKVNYVLKLRYRAWKENNKIFSELRAGDADDGILMDGKARELLKVVYLKPLRDAEREMRAGRSSRISQILLSHPVFKNRDQNELISILKKANEQIEKYFCDEGEGQPILRALRDSLKEFNAQGAPSEAKLQTSEINLKSILESLSLSAPEINPGLGELNLLFMAAELILLKEESEGAMKLALIEELEAHLHPQAQLRLIDYLQNEYKESGTQIIISTHSPILASKINLKNLILLKNSRGYDLGEGQTKLEKGDYLFLQRFLDATKSNLFFAKGIIMVEGDAENILLPVLAEIMGYPLEKYGVSIVNVGSTAFLRYSRIFLRNDGENMGVPVSIVTDCDIKPDYNEKNEFDERIEESNAAVDKKKNQYEEDNIHAFISPRWTLEYCISLSCLSEEFHKAIHYAKKVYYSQKAPLSEDKIRTANEDVKKESEAWSNISKEEKAFKIYGLMLQKEGQSKLKSIAAQCFASILKWKVSEIPDELTEDKLFDLDLYRYSINEELRNKIQKKIEEDKYLRYLVDSIKYATGAD